MGTFSIRYRDRPTWTLREGDFHAGAERRRAHDRSARGVLGVLIEPAATKHSRRYGERNDQVQSKRRGLHLRDSERLGMPTEILMPALSPTMEEGKLAKWLVAEGESVKPGDVIAEIETDKATMEVEAVDEGKLAKILVPEGTEGVKVNTPIALLDGGAGWPGRERFPSPRVGRG